MLAGMTTEEVPRPRPDRLDPTRADYGEIIEAHERAVRDGSPMYLDPTTGLYVMTVASLRRRGVCCGSGCRHCPYPADE
jgi:uncharacterized protein DUF5522